MTSNKVKKCELNILFKIYVLIFGEFFGQTVNLLKGNVSMRSYVLLKIKKKHKYVLICCIKQNLFLWLIDLGEKIVLYVKYINCYKKR